MSYVENITDAWEIVAFGRLVRRAQYGLSESSTEKGVPYLKMSNIRDGKVVLDGADTLEVDEATLAKYALKPGDLVFNRTNSLDLVGKMGVFKSEIPTVFASYLVRFQVHEDKCDSRFVAAWFETSGAKHRLRCLATPGVSQSNINPTTLRAAMLVPKAPLPEQRKIADILTTWDEALEKFDALIAAKDRRKKALMQQLLTGRKRVAGATGEWRTTTLAQVLEPTPRPTPKPSTPFLAAGIRSHGRGVFLKPDFIPADIALDELYEIKSGDLIVNITFAWEGAAAIVSDEADGALVSHRFPTFSFRAGKASRAFFRHYIRTKRFVFDCGLASPGGAGRNRVLSKPTFLKIELRLPPIEEQEAIGEILDTCDAELDLLRRQRDALDLQKRGLMQRLLTGKIRVAVDEPVASS